ncbi:hypothetical protein QYF36_025194 [Acer negundo]|nr:hypothetical protein QYF36_025194 [Acer negundo]
MKKNPIFLLLLLLLIIILSSLIPITKCDDNDDDEDLITKICKETPLESLCLSTLQPISDLPNIDTKVLANFMATTVLKNATDTLNYIEGLIKQTQDPQQERALAVCAELYIPVVKYVLPQAIEALSRGQFGFAKYNIADVGKQADNCEKGFSGSSAKSPLTDRNTLVRNLSDIVVAIINVLVKG